MDFFDTLQNRANGRYPMSPPDSFYTPDTLRDIDTQHYLIDQELDVSDGNLGLVPLSMTPGVSQSKNQEDQTTEEKASAYDISDPTPTRTSPTNGTRENQVETIFNPFGGTAGDAIDAAAEQAEAERIAAEVAAQMGRQGADTVTDPYEDPPLVGITEDVTPDQVGPTYPAEPPPPQKSPLANLWFLGALGVAAFLLFSGKK